MTKNIEPSTTELKNRIDEVLAINPQDISKENLISFTSKLANIVELIENERTLKSKVDYINKNSRVKKEESNLVNQGNNILKIAGEILVKIDAIIKETGVKLKTSEEVYKSHLNRGVIMTTPDEVVATELENLREKVGKDKTVSIGEISGLISTINRLKWEFSTLNLPPLPEEEINIINDMSDVYEETMERYQRLRKYTGQSDYDILKGVWEWETLRNLTSSGIDYRLSPIYDTIEGNHLNYNSQRVTKEVEKYQQTVRSFQNRFNESTAKLDNRWWVKLLLFIPQAIGKVIGFFLSKITIGV